MRLIAGIWGNFMNNFLMILCTLAHLFSLSSTVLRRIPSRLSLLFQSRACSFEQNSHRTKNHCHIVISLSPTSFHFSFLPSISPICSLSPPRLYNLEGQFEFIWQVFLGTSFHLSALKV